jgi:hypothetical protein
LRIDTTGDGIVVAPDVGQHGVAAMADVPSIVLAAVGVIGAVFGNGDDSVRYDLRVEVPASLPGATVAARTASGRIRLSGIGAEPSRPTPPPVTSGSRAAAALWS